ncbi:hypothetical protein LPB72_03600 [Hydrogenophaga crassostreae]|uniref:Transmembrane protein n=1 Tax=Hydrogenophaga crassostreae TaxID=1763535 RepID=A0A163CM99_9BURK|nr:DUF6622 family protein [Hydrogenophaga crassostreae]AOW14354.1 hypothetical protein LPB072_17435 [Hydrogenophaga crassostreae]OAD43622.1 hypothetical protein LPB72_03600 [Hydrogenophaga crassostreae]
MLSQILAHTPIWVFALFAALIVLGLSQMRGREIKLQRASILPLVMVVLSLAGTVSAFGAAPWPLLAWAAGLAVATTTLLALPLPAGTRFNATTRRVKLPGSAVPLALMMGIFFTKYAVGAALGMHPEFAQWPSFTTTAGALYGLFSGVFLGRGLRLWRLARKQTPADAIAA